VILDACSCLCCMCMQFVLGCCALRKHDSVWPIPSLGLLVRGRQTAKPPSVAPSLRRVAKELNGILKPRPAYPKPLTRRMFVKCLRRFIPTVRESAVQPRPPGLADQGLSRLAADHGGFSRQLRKSSRRPRCRRRASLPIPQCSHCKPLKPTDSRHDAGSNPARLLRRLRLPRVLRRDTLLHGVDK
jgi:hypothetical protein